LKALLQGDEEAQRRFHDLYWRRLYVTAVHFLGYADPEAEDVVQETLAAALAQATDFRFEASLYTWLNQICVYQCYHRIRQRKRHLASELENIEALLNKAAGAASGDSELAESRLAALHQAIRRMGPPCGDILKRRDLEGQSYVLISRELKMPLGTVMSRLSRCRQNLKKILLNDPSLWTKHE
jgi:RNA polymerase sigma-70 factor (ECF subfamily)